MIPRPRVRLPLWAAVAIVGAAFLGRSLVLRGGDFRLDLPSDAIALGAVALGIGLVAWARHAAAREDKNASGREHADKDA